MTTSRLLCGPEALPRPRSTCCPVATEAPTCPYPINRHDAAGIELRDELIYEELAKPFDKRALPMVHIPRDGAVDMFATWTHLAGHTTY